MTRGVDQAHQRYVQQASWTQAIRQRAYAHFSISTQQHILEVGSGTGAILSELAQSSSARIVGLDCDHQASAFTHARNPRAACLTGRGEHLPFPAAAFDLVCCHFLLLWVADPLEVLLEMKRVTRPGGGVLCLAEPDYGGRIDHPATLVELGVLQEDALQARGAHTRLGRALRSLLHETGLADVHTGVLGGEWTASASTATDLEWSTLADDLRGRVSARRLHALRKEFQRTSADGRQVLFVPTFYGWGTRPPTTHQASA